MKIDTLKKMIEIEYERSDSKSDFKYEVYRLLDLFESDMDSIKLERPSEKKVDELRKKLLDYNFTSK
jgi:hypothetical protein